MRKTKKGYIKEKCKKSQLNSKEKIKQLELEVDEYFSNN